MLAAITSRTQQLVPDLSSTDFWMSFLKNSTRFAHCSLLIASEDSCTAFIEQPRTGWDTTVNIAAGEMQRVRVPDAQSPLAPYGWSVGDEGWHIRTTAPAIVYASNYYSASHDMTSVLPTLSLRQDYVTQTYNGDRIGAEVFVVAPYDSTEVTVVLAEGLGVTESSLLYPAGTTIDTLLMRGQTLRLCTAGRGHTDTGVGLTGDRIHASRPVAVFQGHITTRIPASLTSITQYPAADHIYEQCLPTDYWGRRFLVVPTNDRNTSTYVGYSGIVVGDMVQVIALEEGCVVTVDGTIADTLGAGETYSFLTGTLPATLPDNIDMDFYQADALMVETSQPASVCYYITSSYFGGYPGDPAMVLIPPLESAISKSIVQVFNTANTRHHYLSLVMETSDVPLMTLDGQTIADSCFAATSHGLSYARLPVTAGVHTLDADSGRFLATFYGLGDAESYAFIAGMALRNTTYDVRANRHTLCVGDSVAIFVRRPDSLTVTWMVDGTPVAVAGDTLHLSYDSVGTHRVTIAIAPIGDTVIEVITVHPTYHTEDYDSICDNYAYHWNGLTLSSGGDYVANLHSSAGCDSVVTLHLSLRSASIVREQDTICPGDTLAWREHTLTAEGSYADTLRTVQGCDSIIALQLTHHPVYQFTQADSLCPGDTLVWHGLTLRDEGSYADTLHTMQGCDSVEVLQLAFYPPPQVDLTVTPHCETYRYLVHTTVDGDTTGFVGTWQSTPPDSALDGQPWHLFSTSPSEPTAYRLHLEGGHCPFDTLLMLQPIQWPVAAMKVIPERMTADHPEFTAYDCSLHSDYRLWWVDDKPAGSNEILHGRADATSDSLWLTLVAMNDACSDTLRLAVPVDRSFVWMPNTFTPDEADNTLFGPVLFRCKGVELYIFNRLGLQVAHIESEQPLWDGTHDGTPCPQGAYVWLLHYTSDREPTRLRELTGTVLLLR